MSALKYFKWISAFVLYSAGGFFLPWWSPALIGVLMGGLESRFRQGLIWKHAALSAIVFVVPAVMADLKTGGRISMTLAGLLGMPFSLAGYVVSLCVPSLLAALGVYCGQCFRALLRRSHDNSSASL